MPERTIALLPGDGIGPEIAEATRLVLKTASTAFGLGLVVPHHRGWIFRAQGLRQHLPRYRLRRNSRL